MEKMKKEPLFHIVKRGDVTIKQSLPIRIGAIVLGFFLALLLLTFTSGVNPFSAIGYMINGCFGSEKKIWWTLRDLSLLLGVSLALVPAFKMKFWNLGGNGQILISGLVACMCMVYMGRNNVSNGLIVLTMIPLSILAAVVWAAIPAIFKAFFNTNETLFTLMMNYIASGLVGLFLATDVSGGSGVLAEVKTGNLPQLGNPYLLTILVVALMLAFTYFYLKVSKHGYELAVVGESPNTARYIGINNKKVIIRTIILSGAMCGIVGLLIAGAKDHSISETSANNMGFTAVMVTWLANFNPLIMVASSLLVVFLNRGMSSVKSAYGITTASVTDIVIGLVYFFIIGCEFFIRYKVVFRHKHKKQEQQVEQQQVEQQQVEQQQVEQQQVVVEENKAEVKEEA